MDYCNIIPPTKNRGFQKMEIERKWAMPNKRTFDIEPIRKLIEMQKTFVSEFIDPFPYPMKKLGYEWRIKWNGK